MGDSFVPRMAEGGGDNAEWAGALGRAGEADDEAAIPGGLRGRSAIGAGEDSTAATVGGGETLLPTELLSSRVVGGPTAETIVFTGGDSAVGAGSFVVQSRMSKRVVNAA